MSTNTIASQLAISAMADLKQRDPAWDQAEQDARITDVARVCTDAVIIAVADPLMGGEDAIGVMAAVTQGVAWALGSLLENMPEPVKTILLEAAIAQLRCEPPPTFTEGMTVQ